MVPVSVIAVGRTETNVNTDRLGVPHVAVRLGEECVVSVARNTGKEKDSVQGYANYRI